MREVVEHQPADRHHPQVHHARGRGQVLQRRVVRMERQRDERLEAARLVLQLAEADAGGRCGARLLDVAVEHGRVRLEAEFVRGARGQPLLGVGLVLADLWRTPRMKDLRAAAGQSPGRLP